MQLFQKKSALEIRHTGRHKRMLKVRNEWGDFLITLINRFNKIRTDNYGYNVCINKCINKIIQITKDLKKISCNSI